MKTLAVLAFASLIACAPVAEDSPEPVGSTAHAQTEGAPRILVRSVVGGVRVVSVGSAPPGGVEEARYAIRSSGVYPLYSCWVGGSIVPSGQADCEGLGPSLGVLGYVDPAAGIPLYRCVGASGRFPTTDVNCQGQGTREGGLGFVDTATAERWGVFPGVYAGGEGGDSPGDGAGDGDGAGGGIGVGGGL
jgi:hypothetical protein